MALRFGPFRPGAAGVLLLVAGQLASAATITVNSTADSTANDGACTLREAINSANANIASGAAAGECAPGAASPAVDEIDFAIPGDPSAVQTIMPATALPPLTEAVVIDGYTQGDASPNTLAVGSDARLRVEIDGSLLPNGSVLLYLNTNGATVRGLVIDHVGTSSSTLWINNHDGNTISGNYLGCDATGTVYAGAPGGGQAALNVVGNGNHIGGTNPGDRNVFAGGSGYGSGTIELAGNGNVVQGNYIGVRADGSAAFDPVPERAIEMGFRGPSSNTLIGGSAPGAGNVIRGAAFGILMRFGISGTVIQGNRIGTDATGSYALGAGSYGIELIDATGTTIGGSTAGAGNVIGGYSEAIHLYSGFDESATIIKGNHLGIDSTGTHAIAHSGIGIHIGSPSVNATSMVQGRVGGANPGEGNAIAYNCSAGIAFDNVASYTGWPILGNSIHSNKGLGITLRQAAGVPTPNDAGDPDTGANGLQNYPVITAAPVAAGSVSLSGTLNSTPNTAFRLEFFSGIGCHASGYGEGRHFLGSHDVMTNGNGDASFAALMFSVPAGHSTFAATATDPAGNTSEFSQCFGTPDLVFGDGFEGGCSGSD